MSDVLCAEALERLREEIKKPQQVPLIVFADQVLVYEKFAKLVMRYYPFTRRQMKRWEVEARIWRRHWLKR